MSVRFDRSEVPGMIRLDGEIDIGCAAELKSVLEEALAVKGDVSDPARISLAQVTAMDVTAVQLLWAAQREELAGRPEADARRIGAGNVASYAARGRARAIFLHRGCGTRGAGLAMANETEQFRLGFREEARELLAELEGCLLELNERGGDGELVARVFRALHTIKGSGAMFGFDELAAFTHKLENAFDEVRKGRLRMTPELVDLTLSALDQIRAMVEQGTAEAGADPVRCAEILTSVAAWTGAADAAAPAEAESRGDFGQDADPAEDAMRAWRILFAPGPDLMRNGADPFLLLRELGQMGRLTVEASLEELPPLRDVEPERCYVRWTMRLETEAGRLQGGLDAIRDVFLFVEDTCTLEITCEESAGGALHAAEAATRKETAPGEAVVAADMAARGLEEMRRNPGRREGDKENAGSLRVPAARLDQLVDLVGELVTVQARLSELAGAIGRCGGAGGRRRDRAADVGAARELDDAAHAADAGHVRALPAAGARSGARSGQERGADDRGRRNRAGQDGDRSAGRSADAPDPQQHGSRHRSARGARGRRQTRDGDHSSVGAARGSAAC